jgi:hypothetical protein
MSHRHSEETKIEPTQTMPSFEEPNPFLSKNDISILTILTPFLSTNGQKLISFFAGFHHSPASTPDLSGILNLFNTSNNNKSLRDLLPIFLSLVGNMDQINFDPNLVKSMLEMLNPNNGVANKETENEK